MITLRLLGSIDLRDEHGEPVSAVLRRPKLLAVLAYLAIARPRSFHRKDKLLALFWPESDQERARHALRQALYVLRRALGEEAVISRGDEDVSLNGEAVRVDVVTFDAALDDRQLEEAVRAYHGPPMDGFFLPDCPEFERWLEEQRAWYRARVKEALDALADEETVANPHAALIWARQSLDLGPHDEQAVRRLITLQVRLGDRATALATYEGLVQRLMDDLQVEPSNETRALAEAIRNARTDSARSAAAEAGPPADRFATVPQLVEALEQGSVEPAAVGPAAPGPMRRLWSAALRRPAMTLAVLAGVAGTFALGAWIWQRQSQVRWARNVALPEAARLFDQGQAFAAVRLLRQAERHIPDDPMLNGLVLEATSPVNVRTMPPGAEVHVRDFRGEPDTWEYLGSTPLEHVRVPAAALVWRISLGGFRIIEAAGLPYPQTLAFALQEAGTAPTGMVHVPGGRSTLHLLSAQPIDIEAFWIDEHEVTNREFKAFLDQGGYERREFWTEPIVEGGVVLTWDDSRRLFRDRTGRPGPTTWELESYPVGQDDFPVGGISWHEAAAYCASVGKRLPTVYQWYQAADPGVVTEFIDFGVFAADGPAKVGHLRRLGVHGTYDMAGNVREWVRNEGAPGRRYVLGGGWNESSYVFHLWDAQPPLDREPINGVRCARYGEPLPPAQTERVAAPFVDWRPETPVSDEVFGAYQSLYAYDRIPLGPRSAPGRKEFELWSVERVSFAAAYGNERVPAQLLLPKNARPPYQTVVNFPGIGPWLLARTPDEAAGLGYWALFLVRSGRAVLLPVYKGMYERNAGPPIFPHVWRDIVIHSAKDLRRAIDYLETRPDIDAQRLAYFGVSTGAANGPIMTAVEPRFAASVLLAGGLFPWRLPPEAEALNFAPRVRVPTLMINGRYDFYFPWETAQLPMFRHLGTPSSDKRHRVFESGHQPRDRQEIMREILDWLDRYLGPVDKR